MPAIVLDGKALSRQIESELATRVAIVKSRANGIAPVLATILVGDDPASHTYVRMKGNACARVGMDSIEFVSRYPLGSIVVVLVWQWTPFMMLIMLAGLQSQPAEVLEAAKVDGASAFGTFRQLTVMPLIYYRMYVRYFDDIRFRFCPWNLPPGGVYVCRGFRPDSVAPAK